MAENLESKSKLFQFGPGFGNAVLNIGHSTLDQFDLYAHAFYVAGQTLAEKMLSSSGYNDLDACPIVFLYRHALELYLKSLIVTGTKIRQLQGNEQPSHEQLLRSHRLVSFLPTIRNIFTEVGWDWDLSTWSNVWHKFGNLREPEVHRMIYVSLTQTQREELTTLSHQAIGRVALRAQMVLLSDRGFTVPQSAVIPACGQDVVRTGLHRYEPEGLAGLADAPRSGRPPKDPAFRTDRGRSGQSVSTVLGPGPDLLDGLPADRFSGRTLPPDPLLLQHSTLAPSDWLALGPSPTGACSQARSTSRGQTGSPGGRPAGGRAGTRPSALPG